MIRKNHTIKINLPGGIVTAGDLYTIMNAAENAFIPDVQLGVRQQLYCKVSDKYLQQFVKELNSSGIFHEVNTEDHPNIMSSYVTEDVFQQASWLSGGVYKDVLGLFDYEPRLKINIIDNNQTYVPFFTGNINFISSPVSNYWYLYLRFPGTAITYCWPVLIYSEDIPSISRLIEHTILAHPHVYANVEGINGAELYKEVQRKEAFISQPLQQELMIPAFVLPYYEGFNRYGNKTWLGIYRRDELFPVAFLKDLCSICLQTKVAQFYSTPWKSFIIKGLQQEHRKLWDYVLGKHRINVRHASNELNWQVEDMCEDGLILKRYLIRQFDKEDVRTYGLSFAIKTHVQRSSFGSVMIVRQGSENRHRHQSITHYRYDILYSRDFNPNSKEYILFRSGVEKEHLATYLISVCKHFYELQSREDVLSHAAYKRLNEEGPVVAGQEVVVHQCKKCFTIYDELYGDVVNGIEPGCNFEALEKYECPTCGAQKEEFTAIFRKPLINI